MFKSLLIAIAIAFSFTNTTPATANINQSVKLTPVVYYTYGDPCRFYDFRARHPAQCDVNVEYDYDSGPNVTLFPFFGGHLGHRHHFHSSGNFHGRFRGGHIGRGGGHGRSHSGGHHH